MAHRYDGHHAQRLDIADLRMTAMTRRTAPNDPSAYLVTVHADGWHDFTALVTAPRPGMAQTRAMMLCPHRFNGDHVTYTVTEVADR